MKKSSMKKKIEVYNPSGLPTVSFHEFKPMQGDLKTLSDENKAKLKGSILKYGFRFPFFVWISPDGAKWINDGHQREKVLAELEAEGYEIPPLPYVLIEAKDRKEAAELLLQANSRYGEYNPDTTFFADFVKRCWEMGVSEIVCGDLREIRKGADFSRKSNAMVHNFWSPGYQYDRLREKAEEYGIGVRRKSERGSSSECPRCHSKHIVRRGRLFKCLDCKLEAHRDAVGCVNIGLAQGETIPAGVVNRAVARPSLLAIEA